MDGVVAQRGSHGPLLDDLHRRIGIAEVEAELAMIGAAIDELSDQDQRFRLLAGLPQEVPASTINRLCGSGLDAVGTCSNAINAGQGELMIAGGVESMSRAPMVISKATAAFSRHAEIHDTTIGWRFVNPKLDKMYGTEAMPVTAESLASSHSTVSSSGQVITGGVVSATSTDVASVSLRGASARAASGVEMNRVPSSAATSSSAGI